MKVVKYKGVKYVRVDSEEGKFPNFRDLTKATNSKLKSVATQIGSSSKGVEKVDFLLGGNAFKFFLDANGTYEWQFECRAKIEKTLPEEEQKKCAKAFAHSVLNRIKSEVPNLIKPKINGFKVSNISGNVEEQWLFDTGYSGGHIVSIKGTLTLAQG